MVSRKKVPSERFSNLSESFDQEKYTLVTQKARLTEVSLTKSEYEVKLNVFWEATETQRNLKHGFLGRSKGCSIDDESGIMAGGYEWTAAISAGRTRALKLSAEYVVVYRGLVGVDHDHSKLYFDKLARFTTYPYFRALFSLSTSSSGLALDPLPSLIDRVD